jgi:hypothetical protein
LFSLNDEARLEMRFVAGILMLLLAAMVGIVEFAGLTDSAVAASVAKMFAVHDPFTPRPPFELHMIFILLFLGLLASGISFMRKRKVNATSTI